MAKKKVDSELGIASKQLLIFAKKILDDPGFDSTECATRLAKSLARLAKYVELGAPEVIVAREVSLHAARSLALMINSMKDRVKPGTVAEVVEQKKVDNSFLKFHFDGGKIIDVVREKM